VLKQLLRQGKITKQQYYTFKGQLRSGDTAGCLKGLKRMGLI